MCSNPILAPISVSFRINPNPIIFQLLITMVPECTIYVRPSSAHLLRTSTGLRRPIHSFDDVPIIHPNEVVAVSHGLPLPLISTSNVVLMYQVHDQPFLAQKSAVWLVFCVRLPFPTAMPPPPPSPSPYDQVSKPTIKSPSLQ